MGPVDRGFPSEWELPPTCDVCVLLCGPLAVWRREADGSWHLLKRSVWNDGQSARTLLIRLLLAPQRRLNRSQIADDLWPESSATERLLYKGAHWLRHVIGRDLLHTWTGSYELAGQDRLWSDWEACRQGLREAEQRGATSAEAVPILEKVLRLLERGELLEEEAGTWIHGQRAQAEAMRRQCRRWLAQAYARQGKLWLASEQYRALLAEDLADEESLREWMGMLLRHGQEREARRCYAEVRALAEQQGEDVPPWEQLGLPNHPGDVPTEWQEPRIRVESPPVQPGSLMDNERKQADMDLKRRYFLEQGLHWATISSLAQTHLLEHLAPKSIDTSYSHNQQNAFLFFKREEFTSPSEEIFQALDSMVHEAWSLFYNHLASADLQPTVQGLLQTGHALLRQASLDAVRKRVCAFLASVYLLTGRIAQDQMCFTLMAHAYREARLYAHYAESPQLESLVIARIGGGLLEQNPQEALILLSEARRLYSLQAPQSDHKLCAWIALHEAEAQAWLQQKSLCLKALEQVEGFDLQGSHDPYWTAVNPTLVWGFKGACLLKLGEPAAAATALEQAKQLASPSKRQQAIFCADLALAHASQGEIEAACAAGEEALLLLMAARSPYVLTRLHRLYPALVHRSAEPCVQRWWRDWREVAFLLRQQIE
jgi:DNA-binding SARP family transcriptional activator